MCGVDSIFVTSEWKTIHPKNSHCEIDLRSINVARHEIARFSRPFAWLTCVR